MVIDDSDDELLVPLKMPSPTKPKKAATVVPSDGGLTDHEVCSSDICGDKSSCSCSSGFMIGTLPTVFLSKRISVSNSISAGFRS